MIPHTWTPQIRVATSQVREASHRRTSEKPRPHPAKSLAYDMHSRLHMLIKIAILVALLFGSAKLVSNVELPHANGLSRVDSRTSLVLE